MVVERFEEMDQSCHSHVPLSSRLFLLQCCCKWSANEGTLGHSNKDAASRSVDGNIKGAQLDRKKEKGGRKLQIEHKDMRGKSEMTKRQCHGRQTAQTNVRVET